MGDQVFIGGYGEAITIARQEDDGALTPVGSLPARAASFIALHPSLPLQYAVGESTRGTVMTLPAGATRPSGGADPCHLAVDAAGRWLAVANYGSGDVSLHEIGPDGALGEEKIFPGTGGGPDPERQASSHAHQCYWAGDGVLYVSDLGADVIRRYRDGRALDPVRLAPGMGPRHIEHRAGRWYVVGELDSSLRVYDENWGEIANVRVGDGLPSHVEMHGAHLYVANRGPDTICVYDPDSLDKLAEVPSGGSWPRHFAIIGDYLYVANQRGGGVTVLSLEDGIPAGTGLFLDVKSPSCVVAG